MLSINAICITKLSMGVAILKAFLDLVATIRVNQCVNNFRRTFNNFVFDNRQRVGSGCYGFGQNS